MDWIDDEKHRRDLGMTRPLDQDQHAHVNARHPGCTLEYCFVCEEPTGRAGKYDDSLYDNDDNGPYCLECYNERFPD